MHYIRTKTHGDISIKREHIMQHAGIKVQKPEFWIQYCHQSWGPRKVF